MKCPSCGHDNPAGAAFCNKCGTRLEVVCAACSRGNAADSVFCGGCGARLGAETTKEHPSPGLTDVRAYTPQHLAEKILRDRGALEGERRTVTVLFSDAMGFTPLSEQIGEEEVYNLMQGCLARMMEAVHKYEGTVTTFTGDGVMALFGAPIAHEDSARRAVAAAREMQRLLSDYANEVQSKHPIDCRFRVGLNTGPVVVGKITDDLAMDYTALGDTVNLASRMEQIAEPGTVYVTETTYRAVADYFECQSLGALSVKGKSEPVAAFKVLAEKAAVRTRLEAAAGRGLTPFVGRQQEMNTLNWYREQLLKGQGQVVFVSGEAGLGKSRLLLEFRRSTGEEIGWLEGHCISYGERIPYLPMIDLLKANFGISERDSEERIVAAVDEGVRDWDERARATAPFLKYLLSVAPGDERVVSMDPMERRAGILDGLRAVVSEESRRRPLIIVIEDLHWIDEKSEEALAAVVDVVASSPVLLILTYRTGYAQSLGERTYYSKLALGTMAPEESATVAAGVLKTGVLPEQLNRLITSKGEGNPFYVEEVTKSLLETGVLRPMNGGYELDRPAEEIQVPDTIQEVILSRIDRLEREAKGAIQLASVIGREFTARLLDRISDIEAKMDDLLGELKSLELIYEKAHFPELAYMFKHALTHDVAYSTLLLERRRALHRMIGVAIEELYADRLAEHFEALAHHYYEGQEWEKALEYLMNAGDKAAAAYANQDALDYFARAIEVAQKIGTTEALRRGAEAAKKRGDLHFAIGEPDEASNDFAMVAACGREIGDGLLTATGLAWQGSMQTWGSDPERGFQCLREAIALAEEGGHEDARSVARFWLGEMLTIVGRLEEGIPLMDEAEGMIPELADPMTRGMCAFITGMRRNWEGQYDRCLEHLTRLRAVMDEAVFNHAGRLWNEALALSGKGDYGEALARLDETLALCERTGEMLIRARAQNTMGWVLSELQDHETAIEWDNRSEETADLIHAPDPEIQCNARLNAGDSLLALGRLDEAQAYFKMVDEIVRNPGTLREQFALWLYSQHFFHSYGEFWMARGDLEKALGLADECIRLAESSNRPKNVIKGRRLRGQVLTAQGALDKAEQELEMAIGIAREVGNPPQLWKTLVAFGDLRSAQGEPGDARKAYRDAYTVIQGVADALTDETLRATFLESPHVSGVRKLAAAE